MQSSYLHSTLIINILVFAGWVWLSILRYREHKSWYAYGCLVYAVSYYLLVFRNILISAGGCHFTDNIVLLSYAVYLLQLAAVISFIYYSYPVKQK